MNGAQIAVDEINAKAAPSSRCSAPRTTSMIHETSVNAYNT
jgi:hypothetical protein